MTNGHKRLLIAVATVPEPELLARWKGEAIGMGFATRSTVLRLCWARWFWRCVEHLGPTRDVWSDEEGVADA